MKYEKIKVVMLPTEKATGKNNIYKRIDGKLFLTKRTGNQHLYFLSDEEIKEGDWWLNTINKHFQQATSTDIKVISRDYQSSCKKIIATTDESLIKKYNGTTPISKDWSGKLLPRPSNEFLKKYCELGGIDEVMVEYERDEKALPVFDGKYEFIKPEKLKVAPDNTITIKPIKDSWNRKEIEASLIYCTSWVAASLGLTPSAEEMKKFNDLTQQWIKENL